MALCGVDAVDADADHNAFEAIGKGEGFGLVRLPIGVVCREVARGY